MEFRKIIETSIYSSHLEKMKEFYVDIIGLELVAEQKGRHVFLKTDKNMLLIFNHCKLQLRKRPVMEHLPHLQWFTSPLKSNQTNMRKQGICWKKIIYKSKRK